LTLDVAQSRRAHTRDHHRVVIVGGGISGLSAAWYLEQQARRREVLVRYTLLEAGPRWGGKVLTEHVLSEGGTPFVVEAGPDAFITQKPWALELAQELGLSERLIGINDRVNTIYVLDRGRPVAMPEGVLLMVPTRFWPFVRSRLFSLRGKLRMGLDLFIPPRRDDDDETLAQFVRRRLGNEALDKIAEPLMSGIYNADADAMSIMATFPRFRELEKEHGSLIRGVVRARPRASTAPGAATPAFMSFRGGMQELTDALLSRLRGDLWLDTRVVDLQSEAEGGYRLLTDRGDILQADAVILTTPAYAAADLVRPVAPHVADLLDGIRYLGTGTVSLAFRAEDVGRPINGLGLVVPKGENRPINAITISSTKFTHRAPDGFVLLRVFFGGTRSPATMECDDAHLLDVVRNELRRALGIDAVPLFHRIHRWPRANPQYDVGHLERVARIESGLPGRLYVTGGAYRGVGVPDCIYQSRCTVERLLNEISQATTSSAGVMP
jgi:oxygen-dependent protoporphyrinogen oxidase